MLNAFNATTKSKLLIGPGVIYLALAKFGVTRGGIAFDPGRQLRSIEFDGRSSTGVVGLDVVDGYEPTLKATVIELDDIQLARLEPGATITAAAGGNPKIIRPKAANTPLADADYLSDVRAVIEQANGKFVRIHFPRALATIDSFKTNPKGEAEATITFTAKLLAAGPDFSMDAAPYTIEYADAVPTA